VPKSIVIREDNAHEASKIFHYDGFYTRLRFSPEYEKLLLSRLISTQ